MVTRRQAVGALPLLRVSAPARGRKQPNILLLFPDQHRPDWTGFTRGLAVHTPHLKRLAARGTRFTRAVVASPLCAPSRACLAAGKEYSRCRVPSNRADYPLDQPTFYQALRAAGYHVAGCGKFDLHKATQDWGPDGRRLLPEWGFSDGIDNAGKLDAIHSGAVHPKDPYMAFLHRRNLAKAHVDDMRRRGGYAGTFPTPLPDDAYCDNWIGNHGLELLRRAPAGKPWYLQVNFTGPHNPMDITARMESGVRGRVYPQPHQGRDYTPEQHTAIRQNYTAMVENIDRWVGLYLDELEKRGELETTLVIYSSDHGEMLGDQGCWGKTVPFQASVGVPFIAAGPGVQPGRTSDALITIMDLAATFLDYAGLRVPSSMQSRSLRPVFNGRDRHREVVLSGLGPWRMVWDGAYKLVRGFDASRWSKADRADGRSDAGPLLFDLKEDPLENTNLAASRARELKRLDRYLRG